MQSQFIIRHMKHTLLTLALICAIGLPAAEHPNPTIREHLLQLDETLTHMADFDSQHEQRLDSLKQLPLTFFHCLNIYDEYASYRFDSAIHYLRLLDSLVADDPNPNHRAVARIKRGFAYFSAGLFKEACDVYENIHDYACIDSCDSYIQHLYYANYSRLLFDLAEYTGGSLAQAYMQQSLQLIDRQLQALSPTDTADYHYALALRDMKLNKHKEALEHYQECLRATSVHSHQRAIIYSSMAYPAEALGLHDDALLYMIKAATYDIQSATKEGIALCWVASHLRDIDLPTAYTYIQAAQQNAIFYGARHRQLEISLVLPIIEENRLVTERNMNRYILWMTIVIFILFIMVLVGILALFNRMKAVRRAHQEIERNNEAIQSTNNQLAELGRIKEEYIGSFFGWQSDLIREVDAEHAHLTRLTQDHNMRELQQYILALPKQNRRQDFIRRFDHMFLRICPDFIDHFNSLLKPEYRITPRSGELLSTELRIFALIRLGIRDNEKIAQVLDYSVNTVYSYKTKIRNRALIPADQFDQAILGI